MVFVMFALGAVLGYNIADTTGIFPESYAGRNASRVSRAARFTGAWVFVLVCGVVPAAIYLKLTY